MLPSHNAGQIFAQLEQAMLLYFRMVSHGTLQFEDGVSLSMTEIHMVSKVDQANGTSVTELAKAGKVTKGAVSILLSKLERKGLLEKCPDETNRSRVIVRTTPLGRVIAAEHARFHAQHNEGFIDYLESLDEEKAAVAREFAHQLHLWMKGYFDTLTPK